jgi:hypothetical protein
MQMTLGQGLHLLLACASGAPLVFAAIAKLTAPTTFLVALPRLHLGLPSTARTVNAVGAVEIVGGAALLVAERWESAAACGVAYGGFAILIERARRSGAAGDCGCFGALPSRIDARAVWRNLGLGALALALAIGRATGALPNYGLGTALLVGVGMLLSTAALDTVLVVRRAARS